MKVVIDDFRLERMDVYTDPLNDKIKRQAVEITRLLSENEELKKDLEYYHTVTDTCDSESARAAWQEEAWKLALKLRYMDYEDKVECFDLEYDGKEKWIEIMEKYTYTEAAAKVEVYERQNEICVGDVVRINNANRNGVVICEDFNVVSIIIPNGSVIVRAKEECTKTGRHIDVDAWLAQIGGER